MKSFILSLVFLIGFSFVGKAEHTSKMVKKKDCDQEEARVYHALRQAGASSSEATSDSSDAF